LDLIPYRKKGIVGQLILSEKTNKNGYEKAIKYESDMCVAINDNLNNQIIVCLDKKDGSLCRTAINRFISVSKTL